jgi:hypothetical protein
MRLSKLLEATLTEAPIGDINMIGNWEKNSSFRARDRKALTNPKLIQKARDNFNHTEIPFQMFFINHPEGGKYPNDYYGQTDLETIQKNMPRVWPELEKLNQDGIGFKDNAVNIMYVNNKSNENVPMTPWMIAHRIGHALERTRGTNWGNYDWEYFHKEMIRYANLILSEGYGVPKHMLLRAASREHVKTRDAVTRNQLYRYFFKAVGKTRAMRTGNLSFYSEAMPELLAQYICTGAITFNPPPSSLTVYFGHSDYANKSDYGNYRDPSRNDPQGRYQFRLRDPELAQNYLSEMGEQMGELLETVLQSAVGSIYMV